MDRVMTRDANGVVIPQANGYTLKDANATAQPVAAAADTPVTLTWPSNAIELSVYPIGNVLTLLDPVDPDFAIPVAAKCWLPIPGKPGDVTTLEAVGGGTTFYYVFEVLK